MESIEQVFRDHAKTVFKYLMTLTGDADLSEELTQETFYQAIKASDRFDGSCKITTWLCAIARNQYRVYCRKHREEPDNRIEQLLSSAGQTPATDAQTLSSGGQALNSAGQTFTSAEQEVMSRMGSVEIIRRIHELDEPYREVLYLRLFGDLSFAEIGTICKKSENWARVTYYRGKEKVRKAIENQEEM